MESDKQMKRGAISAAIKTEPAGAASNTTSDAETVQDNWLRCCALLSEKERKKFESHACDGLEQYIAQIQTECLQHENNSLGHQVREWVEPIYRVVDLFKPLADALPDPGALVFGGIIVALRIAKKVDHYHRTIIRMFNEMGKMAKRLSEYEKDLYKDDVRVQETLVLIYRDIITFTLKACSFKTKRGRIQPLKIGRLKLWNDFDSQLGDEVRKFNEHVIDLESWTLHHDKQRLKEIQDNQAAHLKELGQIRKETREHFDRQNDLLEKRDRDLRQRKEQRDEEKEKEKMLRWLSPLPFHELFDEICDKCLDGTGTWFLKSVDYKSWKSSTESDLLWVSGKPGCGKSFLAATTITDLRADTGADQALAYAFCKASDPTAQQASMILGALAKQVIRKHAGIDSELASAFQPGERPSLRTIRTVLESTLSNFSQVFLLVDGLDECTDKDRDDLMECLLRLMREHTATKVKILIFSRHKHVIAESLHAYKRVQPDQGNNEEDLKAYIASRFPDEAGISMQAVREACMKKADGMFLWVWLLWQNLRQQPLDAEQKLERIEGLLPELGSIYDRIFEDISRRDKDVRARAFLVLLWVTHARTALTGPEMLEAVANLKGATTLKRTRMLPDPENLVSLCSHLVFIDKNGYFRPCHETVGAYLNQTDHISTLSLFEYQQLRNHAHERLAETCLTYLKLSHFECGPARSPGRLRMLLKRYPFLEYAAKYWGWHASEANASSLRSLILDIIHSTARRELSMQIALYDDTDDSPFFHFRGTSNPMHILSLFGLKNIAEDLPNGSALSRAPEERGTYPLIYAMLGGHRDMSVWLMERIQTGNELSISAAEKFRALHLSASLGWCDVLKRLLSEERELVNSKMSGQTLLGRACLAGDEDAVRVLIDANADVNLKNDDEHCPLIIAAGNRLTGLVELLLANGADPNCVDDQGATPLHWAAEMDDAATVTALLDHGADSMARATLADEQTPLHLAAANQSINVIKAIYRVHSKLDVRSKNGESPLHIAAWNDAPKSAQALLELGISKDEVDDNGQTALFIAAREGAWKTLEILLKAHCKVGLTNAKGHTALHAAAGTGEISGVSSIMASLTRDELRSLIGERSAAGETALHSAVSGGSEEIVEMFLNSGADGTAKGIMESSPLHYAAHYGYKAMLRPLLTHTREVNARNQDDDTPLHFAARAGKFEFIKQFFHECKDLNLNVEIDAQNKSRRTALMIALSEGNEMMASYLLDEKASPSIPSAIGHYPIHLAAWYGIDSIVQLLLDKDGSTSKGSFSRTALFCAAMRGHLTTVKLLTTSLPELLNVPDEYEGTPVLAALQCGHVEISNYLLDMQADHNAVESYGNTMLHAAAEYGDIQIVKRLLTLGCRPNAVNKFDQTALHRAIVANRMEVVDILVENDSNLINMMDSLGTFPPLIAASEGHLEIMKKLIRYSAEHVPPNLFGRTAAWLAAGGGHWEVLQFLKECAVELDLPDLEGTIPLHAAASGGYPTTVKLLLQEDPQTVNACDTWARESPLLAASKRMHPLTIEHLLQAGANPQQRDVLGLNAFDYAAQHPPSLQHMIDAGHSPQPQSDKAQKMTLHATVRRCCEDILLYHKDTSVPGCFQRAVRLIILSQALIRLQDFDTAKLCSMEVMWQDKYSVVQVDYECDICKAQRFKGEVYLCKSCLLDIALCKECHEDYEEAERKAPDALDTILNLEKSVQPMRVAMPNDLSLAGASYLMNYFVGGCSWTETMLEKYEAWEQKYTSTKYSQFPRPGLELLKMSAKANSLLTKISKGGTIDPDERKQYNKMNDEYRRQERKYRADQELRDFTCKNHDFLLISPVEHEELKSTGRDMDTKSGKLTIPFFQTVLKKYSDIPGMHTKNDARTLEERTQIWSQATNPADAALEATGHHEGQPLTRRPRRSLTAPMPKQVKAQLGSKLSPILPPSKNRESLFSTFRRRIQRVQTLPAPKSGLESFDIDVKSSQALDMLENHLDVEQPKESNTLPGLAQPQAVVRKTVNISFQAGAGNAGNDPTGTIAVDQRKQGPDRSPEPSEQPVADIPLTSEPEPMNPAQSEENAVSPINVHDTTLTSTASPTDSRGKEEIDDEEIIVYMKYQILNGADGDSEDVTLWKHALKVTDAMIPGFMDRHIQAIVEEYEQREEAAKDPDAERQLSVEVSGSHGDKRKDSDEDEEEEEDSDEED